MHAIEQNIDDGQRARPAWGSADFGMLGLIALSMLWLAKEFWKPGVPNGTDLLMGVYRVFELNSAWENGVLYPRMGPDLNFGYGALLFQFYPPLVSYGAFFFKLLGAGYIVATKLMFTLNLCLGAAGVYCYLRWLTGKRIAALCAAILYLYAPYVLVVTFERGAAAEAMALAVSPWLLWMMHRLVDDDNLLNISLAALFVALTMLAHNITALFVVPLAVIYASLIALSLRRWRKIGSIGLSLLLGLGLSAFYWAPALLELKLTKAESTMLVGGAVVQDWLSPLADILQRSWVVDYTSLDRFRFGLWFAILGALTLLGLVFQNRQLRIPTLLVAVAWIVCLLLQWQGSLGVWNTIPLVRFIQFPWRLFGIASLAIALAAGLFLAADKVRQLPAVLYGMVCLFTVLTVIFCSTYNLRPESLTLWFQMAEDEVTRDSLFKRAELGYSLFTDYTPVSMQVLGGALSRPRLEIEPIAPPLSEMPTIQIAEQGADRIELMSSAQNTFALRYHQIYFPGWTVYVDGKAITTEPTGSLGLVTAQIPGGEHQVRIQFEHTPIRQVADIVSWISLGLIAVAVVAAAPQKRRNVVLAALVLVGIALGLFLYSVRTSAIRNPISYQAKLGDTIQLLAYNVEQTYLRPGDTLKFRLYWFTRATPTANLKVFAHLLLPDDSGRVAQLDRQPMADHNPTTRWEAGELIVDEYELPIEAGVAPGTYLISVGMYDSETVQNLPVLSGQQTLPGDRMVLTSVEVGP